ncbi:hypothetical protein U1Q18_048504 [Sarracenia purpurea var. burkii]
MAGKLCPSTNAFLAQAGTAVSGSVVAAIISHSVTPAGSIKSMARIRLYEPKSCTGTARERGEEGAIICSCEVRVKSLDLNHFLGMPLAETCERTLILLYVYLPTSFGRLLRIPVVLRLLQTKAYRENHGALLIALGKPHTNNVVRIYCSGRAVNSCSRMQNENRVDGVVWLTR